MVAGAASGVNVGEGLCPGANVSGFEDCVGVVAPLVEMGPTLPLLEGDAGVADPLLEGGAGVVDPLPRIGPTLLPPDGDEDIVEGFATVVMVETMVVVMYVLVMYVVGALLIVTVSPFPKRFTICEAD